MNKYAVAVLNFSDNENAVKVVEAKSEIEAIIVAAEGELLADLVAEFETTEEIIQYYFDGDISVSKPVTL